MRQIDADNLIERVKAAPIREKNKVIGLIHTERTAVIPIIRCKECEYYTAEEKWCRRLGLCGAFDGEGYCSYGEFRKGEV